MTQVSSTTLPAASEDSAIWASLRAAIANSPSFQGWKQEQSMPAINEQPLDWQVRLYLRETLETLAY
jgi:hypothetical protein